MKKLLIVEDDEIVREDIAEILALSNYDVITAVNGKDALEKTLTTAPDLIISDISMPVVDGMLMLHLLRKNPETEKIPVIFLTSKGDHLDIRNAMDSGADDYIIKPFHGEELLRAVENRFRRMESLTRNFVSHDRKLTGLVDQSISSGSDALESLTYNHECNTYQKKQIIYKEGHSPFNFYFIKSGKVRTYKTQVDGEQLVMGLYSPGDYLGCIAIFEESLYNETAEAMEETEIISVPRKEFEQLLLTDPYAPKKFLRVLAGNVVENEKHMLGLAYDTLRLKVAKALVSYQQKYQTNNTYNYVIEISRDELASIAGTATESLIRALTEFRHEKLIDIRKDNKIEIINPTKLSQLVR